MHLIVKEWTGRRHQLLVSEVLHDGRQRRDIFNCWTNLPGPQLAPG